MAAPCVYQSTYQNLAFASEDELAKTNSKATLIDNRRTFSHISDISHVFTSTILFIPTPTNFITKYTNADL